MDLLYFSLSNQKYLPLLRRCINSIKQYSSYIPHILILYTNDVIIPKDLDYNCYKVEETTNLIYSLKLHIIKFPDIEKYDRILYIDCDILCVKNIEPLFDDIKDTQLSVMREGEYKIDHESFSIGYTEDELKFLENKNSIPFNTGVMGFTRSIFPLFQKIINLINERSNDHCRLMYYEQPFINHVFHLFGYINDDFYTDVVTIHPFSDYPHPKIILLHFAGWPGDVDKKIQAMNNIDKDITRFKQIQRNMRIIN